MSKTVKDLVSEANAVVPKLSFEDAQALLDGGNVLLVDVRDAPEIEASGRIAGALHVPRGMIELRADPASSLHHKAFDKERTILLYCASGVRSALAGKTLIDLGFKDVRNLGSFTDWRTAGGAIDGPMDRGMT